MEASNVKAMRDALYVITCIDTRRLKRLLCELVEADIFDGGQISKTMSAVEKARQALSDPPRNCDVGTSEEQAERFYAFCGYHRVQSGIKGMCSSLCPCIRCRDMCNCITKWAQMPYEEVKE